MIQNELLIEFSWKFEVIYQLLFHEGVGTRIGGVAGAQRVQLLLVEDGADARGFAVGATGAATSAAAAAAAARAAAAAAGGAAAVFAAPLVTLLARCCYASVGTVC